MGQAHQYMDFSANRRRPGRPAANERSAGRPIARFRSPAEQKKQKPALARFWLTTTAGSDYLQQ
jgi:hypothetical protein